MKETGKAVFLLKNKRKLKTACYRIISLLLLYSRVQPGGEWFIKTWQKLYCVHVKKIKWNKKKKKKRKKVLNEPSTVIVSPPPTPFSADHLTPPPLPLPSMVARHYEIIPLLHLDEKIFSPRPRLF